jgi:hypothetical protein
MFDKTDHLRHLTDLEFIQLQDGELKPKDAARARLHLEGCWDCRWRADRKHEVVSRLMDYCDWANETLGPPPNQWQGFRDYVLRTRPPRATAPKTRSNQEGNPRFTLRWSSFLPLLSTRGFTAAASIVAMLCWCFFDQAPAAQAAAIFRQAELHEAGRLTRASHFAIAQRMEVFSGPEHAEWTIWQAPADGQIQHSRSAPVLNAICEIYQRNGRDPNHPLSVATFRRWSKRADARVTEVRDDAASGLISVRVQHTGSNIPDTIRESVLSIRRKDFHAAGESLRVLTVSGERQFQVREISYSIVPYEKSPFFRQTPFDVRATETKITAPVPGRVWSEAELQMEEAKLHLTLHQLGADISPLPEIRREGNHVLLRLLVDEEKKKERIARALAALPSVSASIWTPAEAVRHMSAPQNLNPPVAVNLRRLPPLRLRELETCVGSSKKADLYIGEVEAKFRDALVPALALERLALRYPDAEFARVPKEGRILVDEVANDELYTFRERWNNLRTLLEPQLSECLGGAPNVVSPNAGQTMNTWRSDGQTLAAQIKRLHSAFDALFITQEFVSNGPADTQPVGSPLVEMRALTSEIERQYSRPQGTLPPRPAAERAARRLF